MRIKSILSRAAVEAHLALPKALPGTSLRCGQRRWSSVYQKQNNERYVAYKLHIPGLSLTHCGVHFPGAVNSRFTTDMRFAAAGEDDAMPTYRILDSDGSLVDKSRTPPSIPDAELLKMYEDMLTVSIMDLIMFDAQRQGKISFYMVSAGEEGIAVGSAASLSPRDPIFAQYRETGIFKYRGFTLADFMNQLFANRHDPGLGRNMPVHYGSSKLHIHTISSPLATQLPQAAGAAYAIKMANARDPLGEQRCVTCYFGEGAASEGDFHAGLNIAATRSCPIIFICRNNGYAISTPTLEQYRGDGIASRGVGYGIATIRVDGNDILAVREATARAREICLEDGGKPVLIEAMSYRVSHHSTSDDSYTYRARGDVEDWKKRDNPIHRLRRWIEGKGLWNEEKEKVTRSRLRKEILEAFKKADREKKPALSNMLSGVYESLTEEQREQSEKIRGLIEKYPDEYDVSAFEGGLESLKLEKPSKA